MTNYLIIPILLMVIPCSGYGQDSIVPKIPEKYLSHVQSSTHQYQERISKCSDKALSYMIRQEKRMQKKLLKINPKAAEQIFTDTLSNLRRRIRSNLLSDIPSSGYLDTTQLNLKFLQQFSNQPQKVTSALKSVQELQGKLQQAEQLKSYISTRKQELQTQLSQYTAFSKDLQQINKKVYYYRQQLNEYREVFEDREQIEEKALEILKKIPAYNDFIRSNSQLGAITSLGTNYNTTRSLDGLQVRTQVEQLLQQRLGTDAGSRAAVSQQIDQAQAKFTELKKKFPDLDNAGEMPDFKPNPMKTKSLLQRLEYGGNIQFQRNTTLYPTTSDIAGQIGYKFHKNGSAGLGLSYKLGLGQGWNHIAFSHQGIGLRSYINWKLKRAYYITGGFEKNYMRQFSSISQLQKTSWQTSALLGLSKKYQINSKLKGDFQILYDFLPIHQSINFNHVKLRFGYNF